MTSLSRPQFEALRQDSEQIGSRSPSAGSLLSSIASLRDNLSSPDRWKTSRWRHALGIVLLFVTVSLWTASNFLASTIFADNSYSKPYFLTYINSSFFILPLIPSFIKKCRDEPEGFRSLMSLLDRKNSGSTRTAHSTQDTRYTRLSEATDEHDQTPDPLPPQDGHKTDMPETLVESPVEHPTTSTSHDALALPLLDRSAQPAASCPAKDHLSMSDTARLALPFCFLWFFANWFSVACLQYTTVASATILTSTSSLWALICGTVSGVETFTFRKVLGLLASLIGIVIISSIDINGTDDRNRGSFPHKTTRQIAVGDLLAFSSAFVYGFYSVFIKKRIGDESRINMPFFFGLVGLMNVLFMWPGILLLHIMNIETFELPPTSRIITIILINSTSSLVSDICWAYSVLLTSPLIVTVGLSLTIPLSLVVQIFLSSTYVGLPYWLGALIVVASFLFITHEESKGVKEDTVQASTTSPVSAV